MVGTAVRKVILSCPGLLDVNGAASLRHTAAGLNGNMNSMDDPAMMGVRMALTVP